MEVGIAGRQVEDAGVVVDEVIETLGAQGEYGNDLIGEQRLPRAGQYAGLHQIHRAVHQHFRMHAQILFPHQGVRHGIGNGADTQLDGGAILHQVGYVAADGPVGVGELRVGQDGEATVAFHNGVDLADVDGGVTEGAGDPGADLKDDPLGPLHYSLLQQIAACNGEVPVFIHGRRGEHKQVRIAMGIGGNLAVVAQVGGQVRHGPHLFRDALDGAVE